MRAALQVSVLALAICAPLGASAQEAAAEPTPAQVRTAAEAFDRGREAYKAGEYVEAAEQFEKADNSAPSSAAIELAIRARDKAGEIDRAATLVALALKRHPGDANLIKLGADLDRRVRAELFQINATCDTPCDLTVGGKIVHGPPDTQRTLFVVPGPLTVRAGWSDNRSEARQIQAEKGGSGEVAFVTPPSPAGENMAKEPAAVRPPVADPGATKDEGALKKSSGWPPTIFFVSAGVTAVVGGITVWSGIDTVNNPGADKVRDECGTQGEACALYQEGLSKQRRTNVLIGVTAGLGVATILVGVLATDWSGGKNASAPAESAKRLRPGVAMTPWASLDGGGLQAVGRF
jgi:hypothetical protein